MHQKLIGADLAQQHTLFAKAYKLCVITLRHLSFLWGILLELMLLHESPSSASNGGETPSVGALLRAKAQHITQPNI